MSFGAKISSFGSSFTTSQCTWQLLPSGKELNYLPVRAKKRIFPHLQVTPSLIFSGYHRNKNELTWYKELQLDSSLQQSPKIKMSSELGAISPRKTIPIKILSSGVRFFSASKKEKKFPNWDSCFVDWLINLLLVTFFIHRLNVQEPRCFVSISNLCYGGYLWKWLASFATPLIHRITRLTWNWASSLAHSLTSTYSKLCKKKKKSIQSFINVGFNPNIFPLFPCLA